MSEFGYRTTAKEAVANIDLSDKNAIVTGGYSGIGVETAAALASAGARVTIACRDFPRAEAKAAELNTSLGAERVFAGELDLSSQASVQKFAEDYLAKNDRLHILVNNAAVMACPFEKTADGFEMQFGTNHLGHFGLFQALKPALISANGARVICLSSLGHAISPVVFEDIGFEQRAYDPWLAYGQAKSANSLMAVGIQLHHAKDGIEGFAVHPGGIMTTLQRHMTEDEFKANGWVDDKGNVNEMFKSPEEGASTSTWAATAPALSGRGGRYLEDCREATVVDAPTEDFSGVFHHAIDPDAARQLWDVSLQLLGKA